MRRSRCGATAADGGGTPTAAPVADLDGCIDVDISTTPLTNTLPVRRLRLAPGQSAEIQVGYVDVPTLTIRAVLQSYTRIDGRTYRYASGSFAADVMLRRTRPGHRLCGTVAASADRRWGMTFFGR